MADLTSLTAQNLSQISKKLEAPLAALFPPGLGGPAIPAELTESFSVWILGQSRIEEWRKGSKLMDLATSTGEWHHQIQIDQRPQAFARSRLEPSAAVAASNDQPTSPPQPIFSIQAVLQSPIAKLVDDAITWIDQTLEGDFDVRLLIVPAYQVYAFWLVEEKFDLVVPISIPAEFRALSIRKIYTSVEFLAGLAAESPTAGFLPS